MRGAGSFVGCLLLAALLAGPARAAEALITNRRRDDLLLVDLASMRVVTPDGARLRHRSRRKELVVADTGTPTRSPC